MSQKVSVFRTDKKVSVTRSVCTPKGETNKFDTWGSLSTPILFIFAQQKSEKGWVILHFCRHAAMRARVIAGCTCLLHACRGSAQKAARAIAQVGLGSCVEE